MDTLKWFFGILVVLWLIWFFAGGPARPASTQPFIKEPAPLDTGEAYGNSGTTTRFFFSPPQYKQAPTYTAPAIYSGIKNNESGQGGGSTGISSQGLWGSSAEKPVRFGNAWSARETNPSKEYIELVVSYNQNKPISITGWKIKSATTGKEATIGTGVGVFYSGRINNESPVHLLSGDRVVVVTGRSPIGASFRLNRCTGYLEQFQDFVPPLRSECARPQDEVGADRLDDACFSYVQKLPQCQVHVRAYPAGLSPECQRFLSENITHNGCVELHKNDKDFSRSEWRVFLGYTQELWKEKRDTLLLINETGKTIDSFSY